MMKKMTQLLVSMGLVSGLTFAVMPTPVSAALLGYFPFINTLSYK
jgi:hypothetical protein